MKAQGLNNIRYYARIFWYQLIFAWQSEVAYVTNIVGELVSTLVYNICYIIFLQFLLKKIPTLAGYSLNDMLVLTFFSQVVFYSSLALSRDTFSKLTEYVRHGQFDLLVIKPLSLFFQIVTLGIRPFAGIFFSIPPLAIYLFLIIQRGAFSPTSFGMTMGILSLLNGIALMFFYRLAFTLPIFFVKKAKDLTKTLDWLGVFGYYPYEAYSEPLRTVLLFLTPSLAASGIASTYFLNKTTSFIPFISGVVILIIFICASLLLWRKGIKEYESASS